MGYNALQSRRNSPHSTVHSLVLALEPGMSRCSTRVRSEMTAHLECKRLASQSHGRKDCKSHRGEAKRSKVSESASQGKITGYFSQLVWHSRCTSHARFGSRTVGLCSNAERTRRNRSNSITVTTETDRAADRTTSDRPAATFRRNSNFAAAGTVNCSSMSSVHDLNESFVTRRHPRGDVFAVQTRSPDRSIRHSKS